MGERKDAGLTADGTWQIGVRRTYPLSEEAVWRALLSDDGMSIWLGGVAALAERADFVLPNGTTGRVAVLRPGSHLRLRWHPADWHRPSVLQLRVILARCGTTISVHQESLADADTRVAMKAHWEDVVERLAELARGLAER